MSVQFYETQEVTAEFEISVDVNNIFIGNSFLCDYEVKRSSRRNCLDVYIRLTDFNVDDILSAIGKDKVTDWLKGKNNERH